MHTLEFYESRTWKLKSTDDAHPLPNLTSHTSLLPYLPTHASHVLLTPLYTILPPSVPPCATPPTDLRTHLRFVSAVISPHLTTPYLNLPYTQTLTLSYTNEHVTHSNLLLLSLTVFLLLF